MNTNHDTHAIRRRNRGMLIALFFLFFGGMLIAGLLRFSGWRPEGSKQRGEMLQPYGDLRDYTPMQVDGSDYRWKDSPRTWRIVAMPRDCANTRAAACTRLLQDLHKVRELMGKEAYRVHLLWAGDVPPGAAWPAEARQLRSDDRLRAGLARWDDVAGDPVWLVDPNGFVVFRYAPGADPGDLRYDLSRLLKIN